MGILSRRAFLAGSLFAATVGAMTVGNANHAFASAFEALFAPDAKLWARWQAHDPASTRDIDHGQWDAFLGRYLQVTAAGPNRIAYGQVTPEDRGKLQAYVAALQAQPISAFSRPTQFAYWVNLYNAATVDLILDNYPVASIRDIKISPGLFSFGPWDADILNVEGEAMSLNDIEHRILRPIWNDPRIHYAVNCAAVGCPNLQPMAFTAANADAILTGAARAYVNDPRGVSFDRDRLLLSSIYNWFREDFGGDLASVRDHLAQYAGPDLAAKLATAPPLRGYRYDWSLNDATQ